MKQSMQLRRKEEQRKHALALYNRSFNEQRKYQATILEHENDLRRQRHDFRHQLTVLGDYAKRGESEKIILYLSAMMKAIPSYAAVKYCENSALNAVIAYYAQMGMGMGAKLEIKVSLPSVLCQETEQELCIIFGNLMENACESVERMEERDGAFIRLTAAKRKGLIIISMENSTDGKVKKWGRFFLSSKRNEVGIGLTSVSDIAEKRNGSTAFYSEKIYLCRRYTFRTR